MIHYSCIGATGYVCGEVLRMMVNHPDGELVNVLDTCLLYTSDAADD